MHSLAVPAVALLFGCAAPAERLPPPAVVARPVPTPDSHAIHRLVAEVTQAERLDQAGQMRLADELRQADPALWPSVVESFRTALAYRRDVERRENAARETTPPPTILAAPSPPTAVAPAQSPQGTSVAGPNSPGTSVTENQRPPTAAALVDCPGKYDVRLIGEPLGDKPAGGVNLASFAAPAADPGWQKQLAATINELERDLGDEPAGDLTAEREARLRLLYLAAGRRDDALRAMVAAPALQDFWRNELYGLSVWLDVGRNPDPLRRAGEAKEHLSAAVAGLAQVAPLALKNLAFATEVQSFGVLKPFTKCEFSPNQVVLLYAEVENFVSEEDKAGFHTSLEGSYRIFDNRSQQVAEQQLGKTEDLCRNRRHDFFLCYYLHIPKRIYDGKHTLQLTVIDQRSKKVTQSQIEFTVKGE